MPTLPTPGADYDSWGTELNEFLEVGHEADGRLVVSDPTPATDSVALQVGTEINLDPRPKQLQLSTHFETSDDTSAQFGLVTEARVKGTSPTGPSTPYFGVYTIVQDHWNVGTWAVSGAANNGSGLIRLTTSSHTITTGDSIGVYGVTGTTEANGQWIATVINSTTVDLQGSTFANAYVSGGNITNRGSYYSAFFTVGPSAARGGLTGTAQYGDDVCGVGVFNNGTADSSAGAFNVNRNATSFPGTDKDFVTGYAVEANTHVAFKNIGTCEWGLDLYGEGIAVYEDGAIRLPNNVTVNGRNAANNTDVPMFAFNTADEVHFLPTVRFSGALVLADVDIYLSATTGTKIGNGPTEKLAFYGATPLARPTGVAVSAAGIHAALVSLGLIAA